VEATAPRILIAAVPAAAARLSRVLAGYPKLVVRTVGQAQTTLRTVEQTVGGMAQCEFLDLTAIPDDRVGNALVLKRLERHLAPPPVPPAASRPATPGP
jgi:hypothetical protein